MHISANAVPFHCSGKYNTIRILESLRYCGNAVFHFIQVKPDHRNTKFFQNFLHLVNYIQCRIIHQSPAAIININFHPDTSLTKFTSLIISYFHPVITFFYFTSHRNANSALPNSIISPLLIFTLS